MIIARSLVVGNYRPYDKKAPADLTGQENAHEMFIQNISLDVKFP